MAVGPKTPDGPITIKAGPLVHVRGKYVCKDLGTPVGWTNSMFLSMPERWRICENMTQKGEFSVLLPPGNYSLQGYGGPDVGQHRRELTLTSEKPDVDLGEIDLAASEIAKLKGKPAPTLNPTDVRGVSKGVQIADYKGKWVALEFWGHWCGPCVSGAIPRMMEIYDDHPEERDKYVVLTVHSSLGGKSFAEVDEKVAPIVQNLWGGRRLPFPILLDSDGKIQHTFGVSHWPTTILFDPDGKLVGEIQPDELEKKLKPVPLAVALPRSSIATRTSTSTPRRSSRRSRTSSCGPAPSTRSTVMRSNRSSKAKRRRSRSRSAGRSRSAAHRIAAGPGRTGREGRSEGIHHHAQVVGRTPRLRRKGRVSGPVRARIERKLKESRFGYDFDKTPLEKVAAFFEQASGENVVLDPKGRMQGKIDPKTPVTGSGKDVPLGEALEKLVGPLGLRVVVRDEVIVLQAGPASPVAAAAR